MISVNGILVSSTRFPDNTTQVWKLDPEPSFGTTAEVEWKYHDEGEFMELAQLKELLDHLGVRARLHLPYLPYGRQDKVVSNVSTFALRTFARMVNLLNFEKVTILDPHNPETLGWINNAEAIYPHIRLAEIVRDFEADCVCYPDEGAVNKYKNIYPWYYISGRKKREPLSGEILSYEIDGTCEGERVLIVDDICDGGATFIRLASALRQANAAEIGLFVTHGIFSRGARPLLNAGISRIWTRDREITRRYGEIY